MKSASTWIGCLVALLFIATGDLTAAEPTLRVGTFDSRGVALAYGRSSRSDGMLAKVAELKKQHEQAKEEGNQDRVDELEAKGEALQKQMHEQVFGGAPIDEVLALIEKELPKIAETADVDLIVNGVLHSGPGVELVDVTLQMCAPFQPDAETLKMIKKLVKTRPLDPSELSHDH